MHGFGEHGEQTLSVSEHCKLPAPVATVSVIVEELLGAVTDKEPLLGDKVPEEPYPGNATVDVHGMLLSTSLVVQVSVVELPACVGFGENPPEQVGAGSPPPPHGPQSEHVEHVSAPLHIRSPQKGLPPLVQPSTLYEQAPVHASVPPA